MCGQQGRPAELEPRMLMLCPDYMIVQGCASWAWSGDWRLSRRAQARRARTWRNAKKSEGQGRRRRRRQNKCKKNANTNANKMQKKSKQNAKKIWECKKKQKKRNQNAKKMQTHAKKSKEHAKNMQKHSVFAVFPIFQDQPRMRPAPTHLGCIIFAFFLHFGCIFFALFLHFFCLLRRLRPWPLHFFCIPPCACPSHLGPSGKPPVSRPTL